MTDQPAPPNLDDPTFYVGIGASAGGLEALKAMFHEMPTDLGVAYIVVQHLSPDFKSMMAELLSKATDMPVKNVEDGMRVVADTVHLIPPRKTMTIENGHIVLADKVRDAGLHLPIDIFFSSLAEDQHSQSIAVILSGTGSDGSRGLKSIKEAGGLVIVQEPQSAKFNGMPLSAVGTGLADMVAPVGEIAQTLKSYVRHPTLSGQSGELHDLIEKEDSTMQEIFDLLLRLSGIDFADYKTTTVSRRIQQRMGIKQVQSLSEYRRLLALDGEEAATLARDLLIGVTRFFRDDEAFERLEREVIPELVANTPENEDIRVWIVACSTGEEAYSIAILLREAIARSGRRIKVKVFATDVDRTAITKASTGIYSESIADDVPPERLARYFSPHAEGYVVNPSLRSDVVFAVHNMLKDPPFSNLQLCVCRNVLIYFRTHVQRRVLQSLHFSLNFGGVLFLGSSESLGDMSRYFTTINETSKLYRRASEATIPISHQMGERRPKLAAGASFPVPTVGKMLRHHRDSPDTPAMSRPVVEQLLNHYVPPSIVVSEDHEILHVYGDISRFTTKLRAGSFKSTIENLIHEDLSIALSTALVKASDTEGEVHYKNISVQTDEEAITTDLRVAHMREQPANIVYFLITFEDAAVGPAPTGEEGVDYDQHAMSAQRIADLESELKRNQANLQVTVEELETTNEELQTSNEELMAANEELQSTNEELQSVNEELFTVNSEYQEKIVELRGLNDDLNNTISATETGIVFLDGSLAIKNFTSTATSYINLVASDIGRPFGHISHELSYSALESDINKVLESGISKELEVSAHNGHILLLKLQPYHLENRTIAGVVISLTRLRNTGRREAELLDAYRELRSTVSVALVSEPRTVKVLVVDDEKADRTLVRQFIAAIEGPETYHVHEAADADEAMARLATETFDIAFVDHHLTGESTGLDIVRSMRSNDGHCAYILLSGHLDESLYREALSIGLYDCVDKAELNPPLLQRCMRFAIRNTRTERYLASTAPALPFADEHDTLAED